VPCQSFRTSDGNVNVIPLRDLVGELGERGVQHRHDTFKIPLVKEVHRLIDPLVEDRLCACLAKPVKHVVDRRWLDQAVSGELTRKDFLTWDAPEVLVIVGNKPPNATSDRIDQPIRPDASVKNLDQIPVQNNV